MSSIGMVPPAWASSTGREDVTGIQCEECRHPHRRCTTCRGCPTHCRCPSIVCEERELSSMDRMHPEGRDPDRHAIEVLEAEAGVVA